MATFLLSIQALVALIGFLYIFKRDKLFGIFYFFLFIYVIFAQVGYYYFSELSDSLYIYFDKEPWYESTFLVILSFTMISIFFALFWRRLIALMPFSVAIHRRKINKEISVFAIIFILTLLTYESIYLISNWHNLSYYAINNLGEGGSKSSPQLFLFMVILKLLVGITLVFYFVLRGKQAVFSKIIVRFTFGLSLVLLFVICYRLSNRTDLIAFSLGILTYEFHNQTKFKWKAVLKSKLVLKTFIFSVPLGLFLIFLRSLRFENTQLVSWDLLNFILMQDYYTPAHMLFAASAYNYVSPKEVLFSNFSNSLVLLNYPFLQFPITELFQSGITTRGGSYGFYVLTEGYLVLGKYGFIYNAAIITFFLAIWRRLASSNNDLFNSCLIGLMGAMVANLVRSQTSFFFKYLYMFVFPSMLLYLALVGFKISLKFRKLR